MALRASSAARPPHPLELRKLQKLRKSQKFEESESVLWEFLDQRAWPSMARVNSRSAMVLGKGAWQGTPGTPILRNCVVSAFTRPLIAEREGEAPLRWCPLELAPWGGSCLPMSGGSAPRWRGVGCVPCCLMRRPGARMGPGCHPPSSQARSVFGLPLPLGEVLQAGSLWGESLGPRLKDNPVGICHAGARPRRWCT